MKVVDINRVHRGTIQNNVNIGQGKITFYIKHKKHIIYSIIYSIGFIIVGVAAVTRWYAYQEKKNFQAQDDIFQAIYYFEAGDFDKALKGDGVCKGFLEVIQQYPYTKTANLALFYVGASYMHQKAYDEAIAALSKYHVKDFIFQARAWCVMGDAYSEQKNYKSAATYYMKAARYKENSVWTPGYLVKAAVAFEANSQYKDAYHCYQEVKEKYPKSLYGELAIKEASRLYALL